MAGEFPNCQTALDALNNGPGHFACHDYDTVREVVMCAAWHKFEQPGHVTPKSFGHAVHEAWQEMRKACQPEGGIEHEINTPEEVERHAYAPSRAQPDVTGDWSVLNAAGQQVGHVAAEGDGAVTICMNGDCHTDFRLNDQQAQQAVVAAMKDIYPTMGYHLVQQGGGS